MMRLVADGVVVELLPEIGGAIGRYEVDIGTGWVPVLLASTDFDRSGPFALASNVLAPWHNRISGGGFIFDGQFYALEPNLPGAPFPLHGNAFSSAWTVMESDQSRVSMTLSSSCGPFCYDAHLTYALVGQALRMSLTLINRGRTTLPFGGGFHPWFPRTSDTRIAFAAEGVWTETPDHLPDRYLDINQHREWDFAAARPLPDGWINNAFVGWSGHARIEWPARRLAATITANTPLNTLMVYSPSHAADFVSIEPVSHTVDAHNRAGAGVIPPLALAPDDSLSLEMMIDVETMT